MLSDLQLLTINPGIVQFEEVEDCGLPPVRKKRDK